MNPTIFGVIGPRFLNQVPTLELWVWGFGLLDSRVEISTGFSWDTRTYGLDWWRFLLGKYLAVWYLGSFDFEETFQLP